jgi:lysozyme family protein
MARRNGWQTSSFTNDLNCVEARGDREAVRDTKNRSGDALEFSNGGGAFAGLVRFARRSAPALAALSILTVAAVSSVEYAPQSNSALPTPYEWQKTAAPSICRSVADAPTC